LETLGPHLERLQLCGRLNKAWGHTKWNLAQLSWAVIEELFDEARKEWEPILDSLATERWTDGRLTKEEERVYDFSLNADGDPRKVSAASALHTRRTGTEPS
jgi:hypothetical protein